MTDLVFEIIQTRPKRGFSPMEIIDHPNAQGIQAASFPYVQLYTLKRGEEIVERDGRYFPKSQ